VKLEEIAADEIRARAAEVLARPEFAPQTESWLEQFVDWLRRTFSIDVDGAGFATFLGWAAAAICAACLVSIVLRETRQRMDTWKRRTVAPSAAASVSRRVEELLEASRAARARGELALALRLAFFALVVGLARRGDLEYRDAWTNRELVERGAPPASVRGVLAPLVEALDRKGFGLEPTSEADVDALEALCRRELGGVRT
jgi:hypothetical protein